jgi:hypothetical protein
LLNDSEEKRFNIIKLKREREREKKRKRKH